MTQSLTMNDQVSAALQVIAGNNPSLTIPPRVFQEMEGEFIDYTPQESLKISFPILEKWSNPAGVLMGGMIVTAFDCTYGPFSYLTAQAPCTTIDIATSFIRPITPKDGNLLVEIFLIEKTKRLLFMDGRATSEAGKLIATSTTQMMILNT